MEEGFFTVEDAAEALRELRAAEMGGVLATAEEQAELEAALDDALDDALEAAQAGGGGGGGGGGGDGAGPSNQAATMEDVEVLSQQLGDLTSPSKSPAPKKPKKGGDGGSSSQAIELDFTDSQE
jgi:hypothetical protein